MESTIPLKLVLDDVRIVAFLSVPLNRLNKVESAVFLHRRLSLFLKRLFFQIIYSLESYVTISLTHTLTFKMYCFTTQIQTCYGYSLMFCLLFILFVYLMFKFESTLVGH